MKRIVHKGLIKRNPKRYIFICFILLLNIFSSCVHEQDENRTSKEYEIKKHLDSLEFLIDKENGEGVNNFLQKHEELTFLNQDVSDSLRIKFHLLLGQYHFKNGAYFQAIAAFNDGKLLIDSVKTKDEHELYWLLSRAYSDKSDYSNWGGSILEHKVKSVNPSDSISGMLNFRLARYYNYFDSLRQRDIYLKEASLIADKLEDYNLKMMIKLLPYLTAYKKNYQDNIDSLLNFDYLIPYISPENKETYYSVLADNYYFLKDYKRAHVFTLRAYNQSKRITDIKESRNELSNNSVDLADLEMIAGNYSKALNYLDTAEANVRYGDHQVKRVLGWNKIESFYALNYPLDSIKKIYYSIARASEDLLEEKSISEMQALQNSIINEKTLIRESAELIRQKLLQQRNFILLGSILLSAILGLTILYQRQRVALSRQEKDILKMRNRLISSQINPHFLHNALYSGMLMIDDYTSEAYMYFNKFSRLLRHVFTYYQEDLVPLNRELDLLKNFFYLEKTKLEDDTLLNLNIKIDDNVDVESVMITPMLIQPLLENAIKYSKYKEPNLIEIYLSIEDVSILKCHIKDTGKGIKKEITEFPSQHSLYYIQKYNNSLTKKKSLTLTPREDKRGTEAVILLKYY